MTKKYGKSISAKSDRIASIDVPEVDFLTGRFDYYFYERDEAVDKEDKKNDQKIKNVQISATTFRVDLSRKRIARSITLDWTSPPRFLSSGKTRVDKDFLKKNISSVVSEDEATLGDYVSVNFSDQDIDARVFNAVSASYKHAGIDSANMSHSDAASRLSDGTGIDFAFFNDVMTDKKLSAGVSFAGTISAGLDKLSPKNKIISSEQRLEDAKSLQMIVNKKYARESFASAFDDPNIKNEATRNVFDSLFSVNASNSTAEENVIPHVSLIQIPNSARPSQSAEASEHVGYTISKIEKTIDGRTIKHEMFVIGDKTTTSHLDTNVKYGSTYEYSIRAVYSIVLPAENSTNRQKKYYATILVSSKPTKAIIRCIETLAPPPPVELKFAYEIDEDGLVISWEFPHNPQRDIKRFQVFSRDSIYEPFQLLKEYDFDDSLLKFSSGETIDSRLTMKTDNPITVYVDRDFKIQSSEESTRSTKKIYSVCCIDAHGMTSSYSAQFEVSYDVFASKLIVKLISRAGAPKAYPNMFVSDVAFKDVNRTANKKSVDVTFCPKYRKVYSTSGVDAKTIKTIDEKATYEIVFTNFDSAKTATATFRIQDSSSNKSQNSVVKIQKMLDIGNDMGFLDSSSNSIIIDAVLTDTGRTLIANNDGSFRFHKFALGDDEVDYGLITKYGRAIGKEKIEKNTPIFEGMTNPSIAQKYKLVSVSNPDLIRLPSLSLAGDANVNGTTNVVSIGTLKQKTSQINVEQTIQDETTIDVELRDQTFSVELSNMFLQIQRRTPDYVSQNQRAKYILQRQPTENSFQGSILQFVISVKSISDSQFTVYGNTSNKTIISTYVKVSGMQSGAVKEFRVDITKGNLWRHLKS